MNRKIIVNAFSMGSMIPDNEMTVIRRKKITPDMIPACAESAVGHKDTARVLSGILGFEVKPNRVSLCVDESDVLYLAQLVGERLPEGATTLPEGAHFEFYEVTFRDKGCSGCKGYDYWGTCQQCKLSFWLSGAPIKDC